MTAYDDTSAARARLLARAERMWVESGDHERVPEFDVARWLDRWLAARNNALGGKRPADFLGDEEGLDLIERLLGSMQAGTFW